jgi:hypothetical protein
MWVFLVITHLLHCRKEGNAFLNHILMADESWIHSFDPRLKWQNAEWCAETSPRKNIVQCSQGALKVMHIRFFSWIVLMLDHPMPDDMMVNGQYCCTLLQDKVRWAIHCKQSELLERGVILLQDNATPHQDHNVKICAMFGAERCWHIVPTFQTLPHVMTGCLHTWKNIFGGKRVNKKRISTLLSLSLYIVWARMNIQQQLIMYHTDGKSMCTALVIPLRRGHVCKHSGISVVLLSCISHYNKIICRTSEMAHICMCMCVCVCVYVCAYVSMCAHMYIHMYVCTVINLKVFLILSHHHLQQKPGGDGC